jgi:hypothetical protein
MIVFRGCAKCQGDVYIERNLDGADLVCLQCGSRKAVSAGGASSNERVSARSWRLQRAR